MRHCKTIGCHIAIPSDNTSDFCPKCTLQPAKNDDLGFTRQEETVTSSGRNNDYWVAVISDPKRLDPYEAECEDLIEHFQMTFAEGEAFKALWRNGMMRLGKGKPGDSHLRNAEKVAHFGERMEAMEKRAMKCAEKDAAHVKIRMDTINTMPPGY